MEVTTDTAIYTVHGHCAARDLSCAASAGGTSQAAGTHALATIREPIC